MGWWSILPERYSILEQTVSVLSILIGLAIIGPWILIFTYDFLLYIWRTSTYHIPYIGGAARGRQRPRAPSLTERPDGHPRPPPLAALAVDLAKHVIPEDSLREAGGGDDEGEWQDAEDYEKADDCGDGKLSGKRKDSIFGGSPNVDHLHRRRRSLATFNPENRSVTTSF